MLCLFQRFPSKYCRELMFCRTIFGGNGCAGFPLSMCRAMRKIGIIKPFPKPISKSITSEGLAELRCKKTIYSILVELTCP
jgi:hypothetical protein